MLIQRIFAFDVTVRSFFCHLLQPFVCLIGMKWIPSDLKREVIVVMNVASEHNTLYVEAQCPVIQPDVIVISNSGQMVTDFGPVSVGHRVVKSVIVQNISDNAVDVSLLC